MRRVLLICWILVATSCAVSHEKTRPADSPAALGPSAYSADEIDFLPIRVGVEYLPPNENLSSSRPQTRLSFTRQAFGAALHQDPGSSDKNSASQSVRKHMPVGAGTATNHHLTAQREVPWDLEDESLRAIEDPFERTTMMFVEDIVGEDRRRLQREFGTPILTTSMAGSSHPTMRTHMDEREAEDSAKYVNDVAERLVRKPLLRALRRGTFLNDVELAIDEFKRGNLPLSSEYQERKKNRHGLGRVSMSLKLRGGDPVKVSYMNWGLRIGTGQRNLHASYRYRLTKDLEAGLRMNYSYLTHDNIFRADLRYEIDLRTHCYMVLGNRMQFLGGPTAYSLLDSGIDGEHGVLFYVQHQF